MQDHGNELVGPRCILVHVVVKTMGIAHFVADINRSIWNGVKRKIFISTKNAERD